MNEFKAVIEIEFEPNKTICKICYSICLHYQQSLKENGHPFEHLQFFLILS